MKSFFFYCAILCLFQGQVLACEFTSIDLKINMQLRTVDHKRFKEKVTSIGSSKGVFINNHDGSFSILQVANATYPVQNLIIFHRRTYLSPFVKQDSIDELNWNSGVYAEIKGKDLKDIIKKNARLDKPVLNEIILNIEDDSSVRMSSYGSLFEREAPDYDFVKNFYGGDPDKYYYRNWSAQRIEFVSSQMPENKFWFNIEYKKTSKCR